MTLDQLFKACDKNNIHKIAITDHNTISNALKAHSQRPKQVIVGEEVLTRQGELLAFFVKEEIPAGLDMLDAVSALRAQGAVISVSHPFDRFRKAHWQVSDILQIVEKIDALETFNSRCIRKSDNQLAQDFALQHQLLSTVGSDAHAPIEVGRSTLTLPDFDNPDSFRHSLQLAVPNCRLSSPFIHLLSRIAKWKKKLQNP